MGILTSIKIDSGIVNKLKVLKLSFGYTTYNDVLNELIAISYTKAEVEKISNEDIIVSQKNILKRLEALHTRIGYFEKDYFLKIDDIFDAVEEMKNNNGEKKEPKKIEEKSNAIDEKKYRKQIEDLELSHQELEQINGEINRKINLINSKIVKKTGVFASGYEMNLSEEDYNNIFK